jgi:type IV secretory pathway TraG/TraD family ATPase VirD4
MEPAKRGESRRTEFSVIQHWFSHHLPFCKASSYKELTLASRVLQHQNNPEMASESSKKDYRMSEIEKKKILVILANPLNCHVGEWQCRMGMRNVPKYN